MAEISLRAYVKELDDLIEHEQLDEAIAHCRHILQTYPKHLEVYRLLGKSYLEAKRYGDAADIFQRVLSAVPDDFVAHIGMAIVREDEGNLDAAIWHMERAFETNPSNPAIQQELRRLIGRRDGLEPHKVRLTRGALARMYAHGELYAQAIAELRSALQEDADRPDLQVLLAEMHWRLGQRSEAAEVCQKLLEALPFCREANRIMAAALQSSGQAEEAVIYHRRLASLDPYAALVETAMDDPNRVDPNAVRIDKLAWVAGQPVPGAEGQPEWAASLGVDMRVDVPRPSPKKPTWLESLASETAAAQQAEPPVPAMRTPEPPPAPEPAPVPAAAKPAEEKEIPDWMRRAGWSEGSGQAVEAPVSFSDSELASLEAGTLPPAEGELAPAEIPDWLKDIAPAEGIPAPEPERAAAPEAAGATGEADWLGAGARVSSDDEAPKLPPGWSGPRPEPQQPARAEEPQVQGPAKPPPSVPTWMEEAAPGATETIVTWLGDRSKEALGRVPSTSIPAPEIPETPEPVAAEEPDLFKESLPEGVPDWLSEEVSWGAAAAPDAAEAPKSSEPDRPAWLSGVAAAAAEGESLRPEQLPWTPPETAAAAEAPAQLGMYAEEPAEPSGPPAEVPDWIKAIAGADLGPEAPEDNVPAEAPPAEQPDWLRQSEPLAEAASRPPLDWSEERVTPAVEAEPEELPFVPAEEHAVEAPRESLAWLRELAEAEPPSPAAEEEPEAEAPGWLKGIGEERPARSVVGRASSPEWLRGIAEPEPEPADQLSDEGTLDWMRGIAEGQPPAPAPMSAPTEPARAEPAAEPEMAWLNLGGGDQAPSPTSTGEWLRRLKSEGVPAERDLPSPPPPAPPAPPVSEDALDDEQVFQWLESLAARQSPEDAEPTPVPQARAPEFPASGGKPAAEPARLPPEEPSEGLEWLEQLASERGMETPDVVPPPLQTAPPPVVPEPPTPAAPPAAAAPAPEVPDWLRELVAESPTPTPELPAAPPPAAPTPPAAETWPALPEWMLASSAEDTEPAIPLPPARDALEAKEAEEVPPAESAPVEELAPVEEPPAPAPAAPIEELAEGWVPPWESLELEPEPPAPAPPPARVVRPTDETLYVPPRKPAPAEETVYRRPTPIPEPMPPARPPTAPLRPIVPPEPEEEIPDWLQTPIPYVPPRTRPPAPSPIAAETTPPIVPTPPIAAPEPGPRAVEPPATPPPAAPSYEVPPPAAPSYEAPPPLAPSYQAPPPVAPSFEAPAPPPPVMPAAAAPIEPPPAPTPAPPVVVPPPAVVVPPPARVPAPVEAALPPALPPREERRVEPVPPPMPPAVPTVKPPTRAPRGRGGADPSTVLDAARKALATGDYHKAASSYGTLIKRDFEVNSIAEELRLALDRNPRTPVLWQALGDAYMKRDRLQDAIEAYRRGMESA